MNQFTDEIFNLAKRGAGKTNVDSQRSFVSVRKKKKKKKLADTDLKELTRFLANLFRLFAPTFTLKTSITFRKFISELLFLL